jgi:DNA segregation ATPase FtsK/SpoIIIE-like protein
MRCVDVRFERSPDSAGHGRAVIVQNDPLDRATPWPGCATSLWEPFPFAVVETGETIRLSLVEHHFLVGGQSGGGKSNALSILIAAAANDPHVALHVVDAKRVELAAWRDRAEGHMAVEVDDAIDLLARLNGLMDDRYVTLEAYRLRKLPEGEPLHVLAIDELALLTDEGEFNAQLKRLLRLGWAAGIIVLAATQRPTVSAVPGDIRELFSYRAAFACGSPENSAAILGGHYDPDASTIPTSRRGQCLLLAEGSRPVMCRTFHIDDRQLAELSGHELSGARG